MKTIVVKYQVTCGAISGTIIKSFDNKESAQAYIKHLAETIRGGLYEEKKTKNTYTCSKLYNTNGDKKYILFMLNPTATIKTSPRQAVKLQEQLKKEMGDRKTNC